MSWGSSKAGAESSEGSLSRMSGSHQDQRWSCRLEHLHMASPGSLVFLPAWWLGSKVNGLRKRERVGERETELDKAFYDLSLKVRITSAILSHKVLLRSNGREHRPSNSTGRVSMPHCKKSNWGELYITVSILENTVRHKKFLTFLKSSTEALSTEPSVGERPWVRKLQTVSLPTFWTTIKASCFCSFPRLNGAKSRIPALAPPNPWDPSSPGPSCCQVLLKLQWRFMTPQIQRLSEPERPSVP